MAEEPNPDDAAPYPYVGPQQLQAPIESALRHVVDPEVALNIVDVGLVYAVTVTDVEMHVQVTMTSAACPVTDVIVADIEAELDRVAATDMRIRVDVVWEPPWTPERMSARAKSVMGW
jgi:metal-sulfur cluster biosynthetic enzyme